MKVFTKFAFAGLFAALILTACHQQERDLQEAIYAPNGILVSSSLQDLARSIAASTELDETDLSITEVSFLEVSEGFVANISLSILSKNTSTNLFYLSKEWKDKMNYDNTVDVSGLAENRGNVPVIIGFATSCNCADNSGNCRISGRLQYDGTIALSCYSNGCNSYCDLQVGL